METIVNGDKTITTATFPEYARLRQVSLRTVQRWHKQRRITTVRQLGKTLVDVEASAQLKDPLPDRPASSPTQHDTELSPDVVFANLVDTLKQHADDNDRSRRHWQVACLTVLLLLILALVGGVGVGVHLWAQLTQARVNAEAAQAELTAATARIDALQTAHDARIATLQNRHDGEIVAKNNHINTLTAQVDILTGRIVELTWRADTTNWFDQLQLEQPDNGRSN